MISDENTFIADRCPTGAYSGQERRLFGEIEKRGEKQQNPVKMQDISSGTDLTHPVVSDII